MKLPSFNDRAPDGAEVTAYDEQHFVTYIRLLDATAASVNWKEIVRAVFELDPEKEPERARIVHDSHLARARWMTTTGYKDLLRKS